jgi:hypothetical protein
MRAIMNLGGTLAGKNMAIHFFPGTYQTLGWSNSDNTAGVGWRPLEGWRLLGAGIDNTFIQLVEAVSPNPNRWDNAVIGTKNDSGSASNQRTDYVEVSELTIDCGLQTRIARTPGNVSYGVDLVGSFCRVNRVKVKNWGSMQIGKRALCISIRTPIAALAPNEILRPIVENCVITSPASVTHADGSVAVSVAQSSGGSTYSIRNALLKGNTVYNVPISTAGTSAPKAMSCYRVTDSIGGQIVGNSVYDVEGAAVHVDDGPIDQLMIQGNSFLKVWQGIWLESVAGNNSAWSNVVFQNNYIGLRNKQTGRGISINGATGVTAQQVLVESNVVRLFEATGFSDIIGIEFKNTSNITVKSNLIDVPLTGGVLVNALKFDAASTVSQCVNNRTPAGVPIKTFAAIVSTAITAQTDLWGVLGEALQYRLVSTIDSVVVTLPAVDAPTAQNIAKAPPGLRFIVTNASVVNRLTLKRATGETIAYLPGGAVVALTATTTGWEVQYLLERETYEALDDASGNDVYVGIYGGETVLISTGLVSRRIYLPLAYAGWKVLLNNTNGTGKLTLWADGAGAAFAELDAGRAVLLLATSAGGWTFKFLVNS